MIVSQGRISAPRRSDWTQCIAAAALGLSLLASPAAAGPPAVMVTPSSAYGGPYSQLMVGWSFTTDADVSVTALGVADLPNGGGFVPSDGLADAHPVGIWNAAQQLVAYANVPAGTAAALVHNFRYVALPTPVTLGAGQTYVIGALYPATSADQIVTGGTIDFHPGLTFLDGREQFGAPGFVYPASTTATGRYGPGFLTPGVFLVDSTADAVDAAPGDGVCSSGGGFGQCKLRAAIQEANAEPGPDTIVLQGGTITLTIAGAGEDAAATGDLDVTDPLTILGGSSLSATTIDANNLDRAFHVRNNATLALDRVIVQHGNSTGQDYGGGLLNDGGAVTISNSVFANNTTASYGGGIYSWGPLTLVNSTVSGNSAPTWGGGGIMQYFFSMNLTNTTVSSNSGEGIQALASTVTLINSTVDGNTTGGNGGGMFLHYGTTLYLTNSTVSGNSASLDGGGIHCDDASSIVLSNSTVADNTAANGGGISLANGSTATLRNSIVAGNTATTSADCIGELTSQGYNLIENTTGCAIAGVTTGNVTGAPANLAVLANNGGPTQTHALLAGSPAIDAGNPAAPGSGGIACEAADQRGAIRPPLSQGRCDIGAYEGSIAVGNTCGNGLVEPTDSPPNCDAGSAAITVDSSGGSVQTPTRPLPSPCPRRPSPRASPSPSPPPVAPASPPPISLPVPRGRLRRPRDLHLPLGRRRRRRLRRHRHLRRRSQPDLRRRCRLRRRRLLGAHGHHQRARPRAQTRRRPLRLPRLRQRPLPLRRPPQRRSQQRLHHRRRQLCGPGRHRPRLGGQMLRPGEQYLDVPTCHFSNYLAGTRAADLVPGKGSPSTDCQAEWGLRNADNQPRFEKGKEALGILNFQQVCTDGDPLCDSDQTANGTCVFDLKVALNVTDPRLQDKKGQVACAPFEMQTWKLLTPKPDSKNTIDQQNAVELINAVKALGLPVVGGKHSESLDFAPPVNGEPDSRRARVSVPLKGKKHDKPGVKIIKAQTITPPSPGTTKPIKDTDTLKLVCNPPTK